MIILLSVLAFIAALVVVIALFGLSLPKTARLERSVIIDADPVTVFPEISNLRNFVTWNPWGRKDPSLSQNFSGEDGTVGSVYSWKGSSAVGEGTMTITAIVPVSLVTLEINFGPRGSAKSTFVLEETDGKTKVTWGFESDMGNALRRGLLTKMMMKFIGKDYEDGLRFLKEKIESQITTH